VGKLRANQPSNMESVDCDLSAINKNYEVSWQTAEKRCGKLNCIIFSEDFLAFLPWKIRLSVTS
jgi:hypothetical protein